MKRRIVSAFMAVLMLCSLFSVAFAAETPELTIEAECINSRNVVSVYIAGDGITNGRIEVTYDSNAVTFINAIPASDSWITSVNASTDGVVAFAWVASNITETTKLVTLIFAPKTSDVTSVIFSVEATELYSSGNEIDAPEADSDSTLTPEDSPVTPVPPVIPVPEQPTVPSTPVEPDVDVTPEHPFTDIAGHWAEAEIAAAYEAGLVNGVTATTFSPECTLTRGMFVTLLYRLAGSPAVDGTHPFTDVPSEQYYHNAVIWAYQNNVVNGLSETSFAPNGVVTREQMVTMLYRYATFAGEDTSAAADLISFSDYSSVSSWALPAVQWAVSNGYLKGSNGALLPQGNTTRAQAAAILVRYAG